VRQLGVAFGISDRDGSEEAVEDQEIEDPQSEGGRVCSDDDHGVYHVAEVVGVAEVPSKRSREQGKHNTGDRHDPEGEDLAPEVRPARLAPDPPAVEHVIGNGRHDVGDTALMI